MDASTPSTVFVTGATGYIGGRLAPRLIERGYRVRCLTRSTAKLRARPWAAAPSSRLEVVEGDAASAALLANAMQGCTAAYYLVHSMNAAGPEYRARDLALAEAFGRAARQAGVERIIYLGGLGETGSGLSEHLASRREVETALGCEGVPVTVLRAAMIIGSGSASFEILRYLVERLPIMITPRWVSTESQPIAIRDVLHYLIAALETPATTGRTIDIGGPDVWSYERIMREMASALHLRRRWVIPVPVLTPRLSSLWIHLVTPLNAAIARPLAEGLRNRVVCRDDSAQRLMPHACLTIREAMDAALVAGGFKARRRNPETGQWEPVPWGLSTLKLRTGAMSMLHTLRGLPNPFTDPEVRAQLRALTKIARDAGQAPKGQKAATLDVVQAMVAACEADGSPQAVRDRALLWLGFSSGGRRRSEIAGALLSDLEPDGRDYYFLLRNSKTNQTGEPEVKPVFGLAAHALTEWLTLRGRWAGPLFCRLDAAGSPIRDAKRSALSDEMVRLIVLKWAERSGVDVKRLSAHSLRSGYLTQAGKDGIPILEAMSLSGHKTFQMVARYYRQGDLKKSKAAWIAGDHPDAP